MGQRHLAGMCYLSPSSTARHKASITQGARTSRAQRKPRQALRNNITKTYKDIETKLLGNTEEYWD